MKSVWRSLVLVAGLLGMTAAGADAQGSDRIQLSASAEQRVANDQIITTLFVEQEGPSQTAPGAAVNAAITWALAEAAKLPAVAVSTGQYSTYPVMNEHNAIRSWRVRQSLRLEAREPRALGELVARLQEKLAVESVDYAVSAEARAAAEDSLTAAALARFRQRADGVVKALGRSGYTLIGLEVGGLGGGAQPPIMFRAAAMADAAPAAPLAPGVQTLSITVSGSVQLLPAP
jgi:predicted secreted protein